MLPTGICGPAADPTLIRVNDIDDKFALPVLRFPLLGEEVRGVALLRDAMSALPSGVSPA